MSSALVRQALEFIDQDTDKKSHKKRRSSSRHPEGIGQGFSHPYKKKQKRNTKKEATVEEKVEQLLALSTPIAEKDITEKLIKRAVKGKPLLEKIEVKKEEEKSILFPEETFKEFESSYFCS